MNHKDELLKLRQEIDQIDQNLIELFVHRMQISDRVADVKALGNIAITDEKRERQILDNAASKADESNKAEIISYMRNIISLSKIKQRKKLMPGNDIFFPEPKERKTKDIKVAYQGVEGAWGEHSAMRLFPDAAAQNYEYFEDVFNAVKSKQVDYGLLPIENSQTGAIGEVYDLLKRHSCYIVGQTWVKVAHCLLAGNNASVDDIREVFSHPEGFRQCHRFLKNKHWELTTSTNTAIAAQTCAQKNDVRSAAIGSRRAAEKHGLSVIVPDIMDDSNNRTRFIAIADSPIYDQSSDTISITFSTPHKSGALHAVLESFTLADINMTRIESRPVSSDKYRFFADLQANILDEAAYNALRRASVQCDYFEVLGCYKADRD